MKKISVWLVMSVFALVLMWLTPTASNAAGWNMYLNYSEGNIFPSTSVSDTTTASGFTQITGSTQPQYDANGNKFNSTGFQVQVYDSSGNAMDFYYAYLKNPSVYQPWKQSLYGPMQRCMILPSSGFYIAPTFTAQGSITAYLETLQ